MDKKKKRIFYLILSLSLHKTSWIHAKRFHHLKSLTTLSIVSDCKHLGALHGSCHSLLLPANSNQLTWRTDWRTYSMIHQQRGQQTETYHPTKVKIRRKKRNQRIRWDCVLYSVRRWTWRRNNNSSLVCLDRKVCRNVSVIIPNGTNGKEKQQRLKHGPWGLQLKRTRKSTANRWGGFPSFILFSPKYNIVRAPCSASSTLILILEEIERELESSFSAWEMREIVTLVVNYTPSTPKNRNGSITALYTRQQHGQNNGV
jgi:hypothetical protein